MKWLKVSEFPISRFWVVLLKPCSVPLFWIRTKESITPEPVDWLSTHCTKPVEYAPSVEVPPKAGALSGAGLVEVVKFTSAFASPLAKNKTPVWRIAAYFVIGPGRFVSTIASQIILHCPSLVNPPMEQKVLVS